MASRAWRADERLRFSVSHCGEVALFAFSRRGDVGLDIEAMRPIRSLDSIAASILSRRERCAYAAERAARVDPVLVVRARVERATVKAVRSYTPELYKGRTAVFLPCRRAEQYHGPDGVAQPDMLREPNAATFAQLFKTAFLDWKIP